MVSTVCIFFDVVEYNRENAVVCTGITTEIVCVYFMDSQPVPKICSINVLFLQDFVTMITTTPTAHGMAVTAVHPHLYHAKDNL